MTEQVKITTTNELENIILHNGMILERLDIEQNDAQYYFRRLLECNDMNSINAWANILRQAEYIYSDELTDIKNAELQKVADERLAEEARQELVRNKVSELFVHREFIKLSITRNLELKNTILEYLEHYSGKYRELDDLTGQFDEDETRALNNLIKNHTIAIKRVIPLVGKWRVFFNYTHRTIDDYIGPLLLTKENSILQEIEQTEDEINKIDGTLEIPSFLRNKETEHNRIKQERQLVQDRIDNYSEFIDERFLKTQ